MSTFIVNEFKIFAHGDAFDLDAFLATTRLRPDFVWRRGDQRRYACVESKHETSGVEFTLGDGWTVPFREQEHTAIEYLKAHREELRLLGKYPGVETFILGLQYICKLNESILGFCQGLSTPLMRLCVDIGVRPNCYVSFDRRELDSEAARLRERIEDLEVKIQNRAPKKPLRKGRRRMAGAADGESR